MAGPAREIGLARQRAVDAGRRHFQIVIAFDRVFGFEEFGQRAGQFRAIVHIHRAVRALGHDLQRLGSSGHHAQAHELVTRGFDGGLDDRLQMRHLRDNGLGPRHGQTASARPGHPNSIVFPARRSFRTATQQVVSVVWDGRDIPLETYDYKVRPGKTAGKPGFRGVAWLRNGSAASRRGADASRQRG